MLKKKKRIVYFFFLLNLFISKLNFSECCQQEVKQKHCIFDEEYNDTLKMQKRLLKEKRKFD